MTRSERKSRIVRSLGAAKRRYADAKRAIERRFNLFEPLELVAYRSEGRPDRLRVRGRVIERSGVRKDGPGTSMFRNVLNTFRRLQSDEIPGARVRARFQGREVFDTTDAEGFFELELRPPAPVAAGWHQVDLEILESMAGGAGVGARADVLVPREDSEFVIISDLDDTVVHTNATDALTQARILLGGNAHSIPVMPGAATLYQALEGGPESGASNPFFYVSMSGWGLYDLFTDFLDGHGFPKGCMLLQDIAVLEERSREVGSADHKHETILRRMDDYPRLSFVLIGDSGQKDPETFRDIARERPERLRAVLLRDVTPPERDREVRRIVEEVQGLGIPMAAAESSVSLARAAADFGLVPHRTIDEVRRSMIEEEDAGAVAGTGEDGSA